MRHPTEGVLRRLVDEPAGVADDDRAHVAGCPSCLRRRSTARAPTPRPRRRRADRRRARRRRRRRAPGAGSRRAPLTAPRPRPPCARRARAAAAAAQPAGRRARRRRPRRRGRVRPPPTTGCRSSAPSTSTPFQVDAGRPASQLPDLSAYGDVAGHREPDPGAGRRRRDGARPHRARRPRVAELPRGVTGGPDLRGGRPGQRDVHLLRRQGRAGGRRRRRGPAARCPPGSTAAGSGSQAGPGVAEIWSQPTGVPDARRRPRWSRRRRTPPACPFETVRDYLLSLPGTARRPRGPAARPSPPTASTLPLPVPGRPGDHLDRRRRRDRRPPCSPREGRHCSPAWSGSRTA